MNNQLKLANRFREVILNGTWIANTNFKNELSKINWKIAIKKSENLNSIAALAQHIHYYIKGIKNVFLGGRLEISDKYSFDFPEILSEEEWLNFLVEFWKDSEELALLIETMEETKLNAYFVDEKYGSYYRNIDAMIEHSYYHLGQIVLINKILN
ncbi:DUF1572 domain-containing protein [Flavobacterium sp.]|uniref:DUF1572 domain-containing protein n=1 Tax=Flavobacterium sp. TaxID=239 RepID=UPI0035ADAE8D